VFKQRIFLDVLCPQVKTRHFRAVRAAGLSGGRIVLQFFLAGGTQEGFVVEAGQLDAVGQAQPGGKPENPPDVVGTAQADARLQGGMPVVLQKERYTSQKCLRCDRLNKPSGREYHCRACGFRFHRDGLRSANLRRKYLGQFDFPVVGGMASPIGLRYRPHLRCSLGSGSNPAT